MWIGLRTWFALAVGAPMVACASASLAKPRIVRQAVVAKPPQQERVERMREPRLAYVVLKVADLERSLGFYTNAVGMKEIFRYDLGGGITEVGISYDSAPDSASGQGIALVHEANRTEPFEHGNAFSRFVLAVPDIAATFERLAGAGVAIARAPVRYERFHATVGFVKDPDGYVIEFLQPIDRGK